MDIVLTHKFSFFFFFFFSSLAFFILLIKLRRVVFVGFFLYSGVVRTRRQTVKLHLKRYLFSRKRKFERKNNDENIRSWVDWTTGLPVNSKLFINNILFRLYNLNFFFHFLSYKNEWVSAERANRLRHKSWNHIYLVNFIIKLVVRLNNSRK